MGEYADRMRRRRQATGERRVTTHPMKADRQARALELDEERTPATCGHRHTSNGLGACRSHGRTLAQFLIS